MKKTTISAAWVAKLEEDVLALKRENGSLRGVIERQSNEIRRLQKQLEIICTLSDSRTVVSCKEVACNYPSQGF